MDEETGKMIKSHGSLFVVEIHSGTRTAAVEEGRCRVGAASERHAAGSKVPAQHQPHSLNSHNLSR